MTERARPGQTLLFDADDTLWENNIYFERAIAAFISYLDHKVHSAAEVRERLNACERSTIHTHGYGLKSFERSLVECFEQLTGGPVSEERHARLASFVEAIAGQEIELLATVAETLPELASRHRLLLVTKGDPGEQRDKLARSGLAAQFDAVEVLPEKNASAYRALVARHGCEAATTWMIGNSPRSDINPALEAGLNAIFVPHADTWILEHEALNAAPAGQRLMELRSLADLTVHF